MGHTRSTNTWATSSNPIWPGPTAIERYSRYGEYNHPVPSYWSERTRLDHGKRVSCLSAAFTFAADFLSGVDRIIRRSNRTRLEHKGRCLRFRGLCDSIQRPRRFAERL